jgi:AcrR family transcriptional regulator
MSVSPARKAATEALLDAAEVLLVEVGHAGITTRGLAERAGLNHGLVHYYFGSMEEVLLQTLERFTARLIERQRAMYAADVPFIEKWRTAMGFLDEDLDAGYSKVWFELQAMAWNHEGMRARMAQVNAEWRAVLLEAFGCALDEYGLDRRRFPVDAVVALVYTFNEGIQVDRLTGIREGHDALVAMIDRWLVDLERQKRNRGGGRRR